MQVLKLALSFVPVWVKFLHLPMEFWTSNGLSYVASGVGVPLYADKVTEEQKRLGFARVLVELDVNSDCPKEMIICRANGDSVTVGVVYPWLPPKCSTCKTFGHATFACNKQEKKVWLPKQPKTPKRKTSPVVKQAMPFDKSVKKPVSVSKPKSKAGGLRLSNSFDGLSKDEEIDEVEKPRSPTTFLQVFERVLLSKGKGKMEVSPGKEGSQ